VRLLLDTHVAVWSLTAREKIRSDILQIIADRENEVFVSVCSLVELAIKSRLSRRTAPALTAAAAKVAFEQAEFQLLPVTGAHALALEALDFDHADPFDRLILAQTLAEPLTLVTKDRRLSAYGDTTLSW
jgi:PIN domain nuclease of toxin-antitoxin system